LQVVENDYVLHHSRQHIANKVLKNGFFNSSEAVFVRKDFLEEKCWRLEGHQKNVLKSDQVVKFELEPFALNCYVLQELINSTSLIPD